MSAVFLKELKNYFRTTTGYIFLGLFVLITGYFFVSQSIISLSPIYNDTLTGSLIMFLILIPVLTMRSFAEESRQKTDQLLLCSPVKITDIVVGKFLSALALYLIGIAITCIYPILLNTLCDVDFGMTAVGLLGYFLLGMCFIAVGIFISVLTDNQIVAAASTFAVIFLLLMMDNLSSSAPLTMLASLIFVAFIVLIISGVVYSSTRNWGVAAIFALIGFTAMGVVYLAKSSLYDGVIVKVLGWFSVLARFENFYMGIISISDVVYYLTFSAVFLYLTVNTIEKKRWS
jgi:ABC-2 type transport system permease protein